MSETTNATEDTARIRAEFTVEGALAGMRLDAALAGALDAPRTRTSGWIRDGHVTVTNNGKTVKIGKSYKLSAGDEVVVDAPAPRDLADIRPEKVDGFRIVHLDDDIVVVDKPAGVAAHPSPGWHGPTVISALMGEGISVATSGAAERQGIVHRLDVGTSGLMVVARSERAYTELKRARFKERTRGQDLPHPRAGPARPAARHHRRAHRPPPWQRMEVRRGRRRTQLHHPLRCARSVRSRIAGGGAPGNRAHPPDSCALLRAAPPLLR